MNIKELADKYKLEKDDFWKLTRSGKDMWIITHDACEKIAAIEKIELRNIEVLNSERDFVRFIVTMSASKKQISSVGEASNDNCKSNYYGCMAEKRGIDRCILKLIDAYQYGIYSDIESDSFKNADSEKITKPQLEMIRRYKDQVFIVEFIGKEFGCTALPELTKDQASKLITAIKE